MAKIYAAIVAISDACPARYAAAALTTEGEIVAGAHDLNPANLPAMMGVTTEAYHSVYASHFPYGFTVEWVNDPENHKPFQDAQQLYLLRYPDRKFDPFNIQPFVKGKIIVMENSGP